MGKRDGVPAEVPAGWLAGSAPDLLRDPLATYVAAHRHGDVVTMRAGPPGIGLRFHLAFHPEEVQQVLAGEAGTYAKSDPLYGELRRWFGDGLLTAEGEAWLARRRTLQPLFTARSVAEQDGPMVAETDALLRRWDEPARAGQPVDVHEDMTTFTLLTVSRVLFGGDADTALQTVAETFPVLSRHAQRRIASPVPFGAHLPTPGNLRAASARRRLFDAARAIVNRRIDRGQTGEGTDLLDRLLAAKDPETGESLRREDIVTDVITFLLAGHETTATALTAALYLLAGHGDAQERVASQVDEVLDGRPCRASDVGDLTLVDRVLRETMRLYSSAWSVTRMTTADTQLGGCPVDAGTMVVIPQWVTHRDPHLWDDPDRFDPDRWSDDRAAERHRYAWYPFGGGPRACIGRHFAMQEAVIALAGILQRFELQPHTPEMEVEAGLTLRPAGPVLVQLRPRALTGA